MDKRIEWRSDNGKYLVLARRFNEIDTDVTAFEVVNGKNRVLRNKDLPKYVADKVEELREEIRNGKS